ncbi:MAG: DUF2851 family protein [Bacteroidales bacterium]|nr:DUF2851 family protein [Bacteroidales bacterium]
MTEEFLQYIWKYNLFDRSSLNTSEGEEISIIHFGEQNRDAGPDFINARLKIAGTVWAGNVEVHLNSSDWYRHNHQNDEAYRNVILHVVLKNDKPVFFSMVFNCHALNCNLMNAYIKTICNSFKIKNGCPAKKKFANSTGLW